MESGCIWMKMGDKTELVKGIVSHLFSNVVGQEQGNIIVNYYRPSSSKALSPHEYNAHQTKDKKNIPSSFNMWIRMRNDKDINYISLIHLYLHSINHMWILTVLILHCYLWLARRSRRERVITSQREQYGATVYLFIGTGHSPSKSTFKPQTFIYNHNVNH